MASSSSAGTSRPTSTYLMTAAAWWMGARPTTACGLSRARGSTRTSALRTLVGTSGPSSVGARPTLGISTALVMRVVEGSGVLGEKLAASGSERRRRTASVVLGVGSKPQGPRHRRLLFLDFYGWDLHLSDFWKGPSLVTITLLRWISAPCLALQNTISYIDLAAFLLMHINSQALLLPRPRVSMLFFSSSHIFPHLSKATKKAAPFSYIAGVSDALG